MTDVVGRQPRPDETPACIECGYDLRGLPDEGQCPECGKPVQATTLLAMLEQLRTEQNRSLRAEMMGSRRVKLLGMIMAIIGVAAFMVVIVMLNNGR